MKSEFEIRITTGSMYRFLMYHTYHGFSGIFGTAAGIGILVLYFVMRGTGSSQSWMYLLFGILFLVYQPWTLFNRAVKQAKLNPVFKKPLHYLVSDDGIRVMQEEAVNEITWDSIVKVRETGQSILVYTSARNAFIWVKSQMGEEEGTVRRLLTAHVPEKTLRLK